MKVPLLTAMAWLAGGILVEPLHAGEVGGAFALIDISPRDGGIEVIGSAVAIESGEFRAEMIIDRAGASGSVSTRQSREFNLSAGEQADIARVGVSYHTGDRLTVTVTLTRDGAIVSQAMLSTDKN